MEAVVKACQSGGLDGINPVVVISNRPKAGGIEKAGHLGVPAEIVTRADSTSGEFGARLLAVVKYYQVELVAQCGWIPLTPREVVEAYAGRIINQHPGPLDPGREDFGGKGMRGRAVHCAVILYNWISGVSLPTEATTHYVTGEYDKGAIIRRVPLRIEPYGRMISADEVMHKADVRRDLLQAVVATQAALLPVEHQNVIATLGSFDFGYPGDAPRYERLPSLIPPGSEQVLVEAKRLAIQIYPAG